MSVQSSAKKQGGIVPVQSSAKKKNPVVEFTWCLSNGFFFATVLFCICVSSVKALGDFQLKSSSFSSKIVHLKF